MKSNVCIVIMTKLHPVAVVKLVEELKFQSFQNYTIHVLYDSDDQVGLELLNSINDEHVYVYQYPHPNSFKVGHKWNFMLRNCLALDPDYIYSLHDDMEIKSQYLLSKLTGILDSNDKCGAVGPTIFNSRGAKTWGKGIIKIRMGREYIINETYMVRAKCYREMGLMHPKLHYYGTEYFTFNWLGDNGYSCMVAEDVSIIHHAGGDRGTSAKYQNKKDYYRPRTTILVMKLFCKEDSILRKMRYFYEETSEPRNKMKQYLRKMKLLSMSKTIVLFLIGTIVGLLTSIEFTKPYSVEPPN
jgi:hypothetical protein